MNWADGFGSFCQDVPAAGRSQGELGPDRFYRPYWEISILSLYPHNLIIFYQFSKP